MSYVLAEFKDEFPYLCIVFQVLNGRHTVSDGFVGSFNISDGDLGSVHSVCESPKVDTAFAEPSLEEVTRELRDLAYGSDAYA